MTDAMQPLNEIVQMPEPRRCTIEDAEPLGGDPPCWAHLFEDDESVERPAPLPDRLTIGTGPD